MTDIRGTHDARFDAVRDAFERNVAAGEELGASLVLDIDGRAFTGSSSDQSPCSSG